jgi:hypothetical protein
MEIATSLWGIDVDVNLTLKNNQLHEYKDVIIDDIKFHVVANIQNAASKLLKSK